MLFRSIAALNPDVFRENPTVFKKVLSIIYSTPINASISLALSSLLKAYSASIINPDNMRALCDQMKDSDKGILIDEPSDDLTMFTGADFSNWVSAYLPGFSVDTQNILRYMRAQGYIQSTFKINHASPNSTFYFPVCFSFIFSPVILPFFHRHHQPKDQLPMWIFYLLFPILRMSLRTNCAYMNNSCSGLCI